MLKGLVTVEGMFTEPAAHRYILPSISHHQSYVYLYKTQPIRMIIITWYFLAMEFMQISLPVFVGLFTAAAFNSHKIYKSHGWRLGLQEFCRRSGGLAYVGFMMASVTNVVQLCIWLVVFSVLSSMFDEYFPPIKKEKEGVMLGFGVCAATIGLLAYTFKL